VLDKNLEPPVIEDGNAAVAVLSVGASGDGAHCLAVGE
jgi:hypothetical protein